MAWRARDDCGVDILSTVQRVIGLSCVSNNHLIIKADVFDSLGEGWVEAIADCTTHHSVQIYNRSYCIEDFTTYAHTLWL